MNIYIYTYIHIYPHAKAALPQTTLAKLLSKGNLTDTFQPFYRNHFNECIKAVTTRARAAGQLRPQNKDGTFMDEDELPKGSKQSKKSKKSRKATGCTTKHPSSMTFFFVTGRYHSLMQPYTDIHRPPKGPYIALQRALHRPITNLHKPPKRPYIAL